MSRGPSRPRLLVLVAMIGALGLVAAAFVSAIAATPGPGAGPDAEATRALGAAREQRRPVIVFRSLDGRPSQPSGRIAVTGTDAGAPAPALATRRCARVHLSATNGLCLAGDARGGYRALVLGPDLRVRHAIDVAGAPSRVRVSPDGRLGSVTLFVTGHAYETTGISTETTLIDLDRGARIAQLEEFTTFDGERQVTAEDMNFWGVTFARDGDRFYATMATGGRTSLVEGSVRERTMRTVHRNVECPSLSPDGTRIAFKKRVAAGEEPWRLTVLDLATGRETPVSDDRSVDDQVEWLDADRLLYGHEGQIWVTRADGRGRPAVLRRAAASPAVVRW